MPKDRIILALNTSDFVRAHCLVSMLSPHVGYFKFGSELTSAMLCSLLFSSESVAMDNLSNIRAIFNEAKDRIIWDVRLTGIASVVGSTTKIFSDLGANMISVQVGQSISSIKAAIENKGRSLLFAATPLSSTNIEECRRQMHRVPDKQMLRLTPIADGIDGIICSSFETSMMRELFPDSLIATRDVRPAWFNDTNNKKEITPGDAIAAGADAVVIGKPISQPPSSVGGPTQVAEYIAQEIAEALILLNQKGENYQNSNTAS